MTIEWSREKPANAVVHRSSRTVFQAFYHDDVLDEYRVQGSIWALRVTM
jgi:hypothetical protein